MAEGEGTSSNNFLIYSIQRTYILNSVLTPEKRIITCNQRIDIPTIEPLPQMRPAGYNYLALTVVPCIELAGELLDEFNLTFETNDGVTVLPIKIYPSDPEVTHPLENPYAHFRYVLVLPRGAMGVKSCKIIHKATGEEIQHNFTFGIMSPPYNYDNALFGVISTSVLRNSYGILEVFRTLNTLKLTTKTPTFDHKDLPKGAGKQTINIERGVLFYNTSFSYPLSPEPTIHNPKITLHGSGHDLVYTLSLSKPINNVSIDLFTGMITVYARDTGEIMQQFKLALPYQGFETLSFENFDDIDDSVLRVSAKGASVEGASSE